MRVELYYIKITEFVNILGGLKMKKTKFIFVTGGVVSSLGKGITAASLGRLLKNRGLSVTLQKFDPYLNVDPGTMSPYQHGEVFVTEDGAETDLDLGHYERFIDENLTKNSNVTTGRIYGHVIEKERKGEFLGETVQVIPHITDEIKAKIMEAADNKAVDIVITEVGGTVGDIESLPFLEAIRQMPFDVGSENILVIHVTLLPYLQKAGELKTKPTQHSVRELRSIGIQPDIIVCRSEKSMDLNLKKKIALFCNVDTKDVIENKDADTLYEIPLMLHEQGLDDRVCEKLRLGNLEANNAGWEDMVFRMKSLQKEVNIALVGKYVELHDAYLSVVEALQHGGLQNNYKVKITWVNVLDVTQKNLEEIFSHVDGILIPGGFGQRGIEEKVQVVRYAREKKIPFFGICLGMQVAVMEYARNILGLKNANSTEFSAMTKEPVIHLLESQKGVTIKGGTMRLGAYRANLKEGSLARKAYQCEGIIERHRHRYEFNNAYRESFLEAGLILSGRNVEHDLVEIVELEDHPWFVGCQFHPEFKSRPSNPHPLFVDFIGAAIKNK